MGVAILLASPGTWAGPNRAASWQELGAKIDPKLLEKNANANANPGDGSVRPGGRPVPDAIKTGYTDPINPGAWIDESWVKLLDGAGGETVQDGVIVDQGRQTKHRRALSQVITSDSTITVETDATVGIDKPSSIDIIAAEEASTIALSPADQLQLAIAKAIGPGIPLPLPIKGLVFNGVNTSWSAYQTVCISVAQAPIDVYFLADTTGSMGSDIAAVKAAANSIYTTLTGTMSNLAIGVGSYKDHQADGVVTTSTGGAGIGFWDKMTLTTSHTLAGFTSALSSWTAMGGGDWPEDQLWALQRLATGQPWRPAAVKMVVWFGDAPGKNPSGFAGSLPFPLATFTSAQAALVSAGIRVLAIDTASLDATAQASSLATATGGQYFPGVSPATIAATIVNAVLNTPTTIKPVVSCSPSLGVLIDVIPIPPAPVATPGKPACWRIRVRVCDSVDCRPRRFTCQIQWLNQATNALLGVTPITVNVPGYDTTPPVFVPAMPPSWGMSIMCPDKWKPPIMEAKDNCGPVVPKMTSTFVPDPLCGAPLGTTTYVWTATDAAGNSVSSTGVVNYVDMTPPMVSNPQCNNMAWCYQLQGGVVNPGFCLSPSEIQNKFGACFSDKCSLKLTVTATCDTCDMATFTANPPFTVDCEWTAAGGLCFKLTGVVREFACCRIKLVATDCSGNSVTLNVRMCFLQPGTPLHSSCTQVVKPNAAGVFEIWPNSIIPPM